MPSLPFFYIPSFFVVVWIFEIPLKILSSLAFSQLDKSKDIPVNSFLLFRRVPPSRDLHSPSDLRLIRVLFFPRPPSPPAYQRTSPRFSQSSLYPNATSPQLLIRIGFPKTSPPFGCPPLNPTYFFEALLFMNPPLVLEIFTTCLAIACCSNLLPSPSTLRKPDLTQGYMLQRRFRFLVVAPDSDLTYLRCVSFYFP